MLLEAKSQVKNCKNHFVSRSLWLRHLVLKSLQNCDVLPL